MVPTDTRLKIAVFIDFDNVEIGVKSTIGGQFDIGLVLEAIKERGEIVTKVAYSDWKRAGDYSRLLTQHAIRMVQRNLTPGGDKNGADITMALDALEMAFTHAHINAFVIVGGDSDFISLVEKLKQYDRKVIVVGGRQFTSATMQKNCHEFIAYENLVGSHRPPRQASRGGRPAGGGSEIARALPLVKRALQVLSEREVTPQLGLLKSTLLQLDSTFSEREFGASTFRDFMEKVAAAGAVTLKHAGRSLLVESKEDGAPADVIAPEVGEVVPPKPQPQATASRSPLPQADVEDTEGEPTAPVQIMEGVRALQQALAQGAPRWPMYVRQMKQYLKNITGGFDERAFGFASLVDLLRAAQKAGVLRLERDRQGVMRVFGGPSMPRPTGVSMEASVEPASEVTEVADAEAIAAEDVLRAEPVIEEAVEPPIIDAEIAEPQEVPAEDGLRKVAGRRRRTAVAGATKRAAKPAAPRTKRPPKTKSTTVQ